MKTETLSITSLLPLLLVLGLGGCRADGDDNSANGPADSGNPAPEATSVMSPAIAFNDSVIGDIITGDALNGDDAVLRLPGGLAEGMHCLGAAVRSQLVLADSFLMERQLRGDASNSVIATDVLATEAGLLMEITNAGTAAILATFLPSEVDCREELPALENIDDLVTAIKEDMNEELEQAQADALAELLDKLVAARQAAQQAATAAPVDSTGLVDGLNQLSVLIGGQDNGASSFAAIMTDGDDTVPLFTDFYVVAGRVMQQGAALTTELAHSAHVDDLLATSLVEYAQRALTQLLPLDLYEAVFSDGDAWEGDTGPVLDAIDDLRDAVSQLNIGDLLDNQQLDSDNLDATLNGSLLNRAVTLADAIGNAERAQAECGTLPVLGPILCSVANALDSILGGLDGGSADLFNFLAGRN